MEPLTPEARLEAADNIQSILTGTASTTAPGGISADRQAQIEHRQAAIKYLESKVTPQMLKMVDPSTPPALAAKLGAFKKEIENSRKITVEEAVCNEDFFGTINPYPLQEIPGYKGLISLHYTHRSNMSPTIIDGFKKSSFIFDLGLPSNINNDKRVRDGVSDMGVTTLAGLLLKTEADFLSMPNVGNRSLRILRENLEELDLHLGMTVYELLNLERNPPAALLDAYPKVSAWLHSGNLAQGATASVKPSTIAHDTYDTPADVNDVNIWPGSVYRFNESKDAQRFVTAASTVFKDAGGIKDASYISISHLGFKETPSGKEFLVHVSDAALSVLSTSEGLSKLKAAISPAKESGRAI